MAWTVRGNLRGPAGPPADTSALVPKSSTFTEPATEGQLLESNMDVTGVGGAEPVIFRALLSGVRKRVTWLNERHSLRLAAVQAEPSLKIFKTYAASYTGMILQVLTTWDGTGSQRHLIGWNTKGQPIIGDGGVGNTQTVGSNVIALDTGQAVPAHPDRTLFARPRV